MRLDTFRVEGFRSIRDATLELRDGVTLLIGANGAGKSNVIGAMELLGRVVDNSFSEELLRMGGVRAQLHASPTGDDAETICLSVASKPRGSVPHGGDRFVNRYSVCLQASDDDAPLIRETTGIHNIDKYDKAYETSYGLSARSVIRRRAEESDGITAATHIAAMAGGVRVFHVDDTSPQAPALQRADEADDLTLHDDAANLAPVLLRLKKHDRPRYDRIVRSVRVVAPFFDDFVLQPLGGHVQLRWRQIGMDRVFHGRFLSSGTLRFISLATLLLQDSMPGVVVLDEPELGLHPVAISQLAELLTAAAEHVQVVAATQSVPLLSCFAVDDVVLVDRTGGTTTLAAPPVEALDAWLDEYTTGELWEMNLLGGMPGPDIVPPPREQGAAS